METIYKCSQSKGIKWFFAIFFVLFALAILVEMYYVSKGMNLTWAIIVTAILLVASFSCFFLFPRYIIAVDEGIGIRTLLRTKWIPYENIDHIERIDNQHPLFVTNKKIGKMSIGFSYQKGLFGTTNTILLFGVSGMSVHIGWFRTKGVGTFRSYVTDAKKAFLIYRTKGLPIAISVSEPDEFLPYYLKGGKK